MKVASRRRAILLVAVVGSVAAIATAPAYDCVQISTGTMRLELVPGERRDFSLTVCSPRPFENDGGWSGRLFGSYDASHYVSAEVLAAEEDSGPVEVRLGRAASPATRTPSVDVGLEFVERGVGRYCNAEPIELSFWADPGQHVSLTWRVTAGVFVSWWGEHAPVSIEVREE